MVEGPLSEIDLQEIKTQLSNLNLVDAEIKRATSAGMDMSQQKKDALEARTKLTKLKQAYFPNG